MNRRSFLSSLPLLPAAVKAVGAQPLDISAIFAQTKEAPLRLRSHWMQTARLNRFMSLEYMDAIDVAFGGQPAVLRRNWHERRRVRFRENLDRQLAMTAPRLP